MHVSASSSGSVELREVFHLLSRFLCDVRQRENSFLNGVRGSVSSQKLLYRFKPTGASNFVDGERDAHRSILL